MGHREKDMVEIKQIPKVRVYVRLFNLWSRVQREVRRIPFTNLRHPDG